MHGFVEAQSFLIWPWIEMTSLTWKLFPIHERFKANEFRVGGWFRFFQKTAKRKSHPRDDHAPAFYTAQAVDPFLLRELAEQIFHAVRSSIADQARDFHRPRMALEILRKLAYRLLVLA